MGKLLTFALPIMAHSYIFRAEARWKCNESPNCVILAGARSSQSKLQGRCLILARDWLSLLSVSTGASRGPSGTGFKIWRQRCRRYPPKCHFGIMYGCMTLILFGHGIHQRRPHRRCLIHELSHQSPPTLENFHCKIATEFLLVPVYTFLHNVLQPLSFKCSRGGKLVRFINRLGEYWTVKLG